MINQIATILFFSKDGMKYKKIALKIIMSPFPRKYYNFCLVYWCHYQNPGA
jgi:hypothetical protein